MKKVKMLNIPIASLTMQESINVIDKCIQEKIQIHHCVVNAAKIVMMQTNQELQESVLAADMINADGQAVVWAARILGKYLPERVAGCDLMQKLVHLAYTKKYKIFFLGATEETVLKVVNKYKQQYSQEIIAGYRNGYFSAKEEKEVAMEISKSHAQILFVAISSPKKENFLHQNKELLKNINFIMGVGGSFDVVSGKTKRAPLWVQKAGFEWFYRFLQEPRRLWKKEIINNIEFVYLIIKTYLKIKIKFLNSSKK